MLNRVKIFGIIAIVTIIGFGFAACGGDDDTGGTHTHTYGSEWLSNETQHWKECTGAGCDVKTETANHSPADGICLICQYDNTPSHTHTYSTTWSNNTTQHWKECTGASCNAKTETANHSPADGICLICQYDNTPPHTHTYSTTWSSNTTQHWKECTGAGCDVKTETANHSPADGFCLICQYNNTPSHTHTYVYTVTSISYPAQSIQTCSCGDTTGTARNTIIGDTGPADGIIFYYSEEGFIVTGTDSFTAHYLEASPVNLGAVAWASPEFIHTSYGGTGNWGDIKTGDAIGTGRENTKLILATDANAPAAKSCKDYDRDGKNDWFLPSSYELNEMYKARTHLGISSGYIWSSSQYSLTSALGQRFDDGYAGSVGKFFNVHNVRAVRAF